jgi:hypothetical protein
LIPLVSLIDSIRFVFDKQAFRNSDQAQRILGSAKLDDLRNQTIQSA